MKQKQLSNNKIGPQDGYIKENQITPDEDKVAITDISQEEMKSAIPADKEIKVKGMDKVARFIDKAFSEDRRKMEWRVAVNIIDNLFFVVFIITIIISSLVILIPKNESWIFGLTNFELPSILHNQ